MGFKCRIIKIIKNALSSGTASAIFPEAMERIVTIWAQLTVAVMNVKQRKSIYCSQIFHR